MTTNVILTRGGPRLLHRTRTPSAVPLGKSLCHRSGRSGTHNFTNTTLMHPSTLHSPKDNLKNTGHKYPRTVVSRTRIPGFRPQSSTPRVSGPSQTVRSPLPSLSERDTKSEKERPSSQAIFVDCISHVEEIKPFSLGFRN